MDSPDTRFIAHTRIVLVAVVLALTAALTYVLIGQNLLSVGDLQVNERPMGIIIAAASSYIAGGLLITARNRWLWAVGAVINALVILFFFQMHGDRPSVLFSPGGLASKAAQVLLELALIYLIFADWRQPARHER